jgi:leucyl-tRNA synthetase
MYSRTWHKFLYDLGIVPTIEPFKKLVNQGMITAYGYYLDSIFIDDENGNSVLWYGNHDLLTKQKANISAFSRNSLRLPYINEYLDSDNKISKIDFIKYYEEVGSKFNVFPPNLIDTKYWLLNESRNYVPNQSENGEDFITINVVQEKMSKSKYNVQNPDEVVAKYGADCFRMYEMFLGPLEQSKPWDTKGIDGVQKFLRKFWSLYYNETGLNLSDDAPTAEEYKILHTAIKKISEDIERFSFNTCVSAFMVCVNELKRVECNKRQILEPLTILLGPFAPFITEELWANMGHEGSVHKAQFPQFDAKHLVQDTIEYPVSINGKKRDTIMLSAQLTQEEIQAQVMELDQVKKYVEGKEIQKVIIVLKRMVNIVVKE